MRSLAPPPVWLSACLLLLCTPPAPEAQIPGGHLIVQVVNAGTGQALPGTQVVVQGGMGGITDESGVFRLEWVPLGTRTVEVRHLGYAPANSQVLLESGRTSAVRFELELRPVELAEVRVRTRRPLLKTRGFLDRRASGFGTFLTRHQIEEMQPRYLSDVLRRVAGIQLSSSHLGGITRATIRGHKVLGSCPVQYYIDGTLTSMFNVDDIPPHDVEGMEIYRGAATIPTAYNKGTAMCGLVLIWTRVQ